MLAYTGKGRFYVERLNLSDLVPEMSRLIQPSIPKKITLRFDLVETLPFIEADRGQVQQVFHESCSECGGGDRRRQRGHHLREDRLDGGR
jgi:hypothetical protein